MRAAVKSIANNDSGGLAEYIGVNALKPYINKDLVAAELIELDKYKSDENLRKKDIVLTFVRYL